MFRRDFLKAAALAAGASFVPGIVTAQEFCQNRRKSLRGDSGGSGTCGASLTQGCWMGSTSSFAWSSNNITVLSANHGIYSPYSTITGTGSFNVTIGVGSNLAGGLSWTIALFAASEIGTFNQNASYAGLDGMTNSFYARNTASNKLEVFRGAVTDGTFTFAEGDIATLSVSSGTITLKRNGSIVYTWVATYSSQMYPCLCAGFTQPVYNNCTIS